MKFAKNLLAIEDRLLAWQAGNMAAVWDGLQDEVLDAWEESVRRVFPAALPAKR